MWLYIRIVSTQFRSRQWFMRLTVLSLNSTSYSLMCSIHDHYLLDSRCSIINYCWYFTLLPCHYDWLLPFTCYWASPVIRPMTHHTPPMTVCVCVCVFSLIKCSFATRQSSCAKHANTFDDPTISLNRVIRHRSDLYCNLLHCTVLFCIIL